MTDSRFGPDGPLTVPLPASMVRRGGTSPVLYLEAGSLEVPLLEGIRLLTARLDSLRVPYADTTFVGGHIDRVRERFTDFMLPAVGRWFRLP